MPESGLKRFIAWQKGYDTEISLINEQHKGILAFINNWYREIQEDLAFSASPARIRKRLDYLVGFSKGHLRFETELLKRLAQHYGYPKQEFEDHMQAHRQFMEGLLRPMIKEINVNPTKDAALFLETVVHESLFDIARWWSDHIRTPAEGEKPGPDHKYRVFLARLPKEDLFHLMDEMLIYIALNDNTFWLKQINPAAQVGSPDGDPSD